MTEESRYDEGLEEIWRIKREIASEYPTLEEYFKGMLAYQEERRRSGVKFVRLPPRRVERPASPVGEPHPAVSVSSLSVAEGDHPYDGSAPI